VLDERKEKILAAVVEDFIDTAEPIGSRTIARRCGLGLSPATIRNEMADLEEMGYLKQPYTSAGRIPSELGYRYYVDHLMEPEEPREKEKELLRRYITAKSREIAGVIRQTGQILSQLTNYAAIVTAPCGKSVYQHIQLVPFGVGQAMVLVVLASGDVFHRLIPVPEGITPYDLEALSRVLNAKLRGLTVRDIKLTLLKEIYAELSHCKALLDTAFALIQEALEVKEERVYQGGIYGILNQPEFRDVSRLQTLLGLLDQEDFLCDLLTSQREEHGVSIRIGQEFKHPNIRELSMVTVTYRIDNDLQGVLAVLGPMRMRYRRVAGMLRYVAESLSAELARFFR